MYVIWSWPFLDPCLGSLWSVSWPGLLWILTARWLIIHQPILREHMDLNNYDLTKIFHIKIQLIALTIWQIMQTCFILQSSHHITIILDHDNSLLLSSHSLTQSRCFYLRFHSTNSSEISIHWKFLLQFVLIMLGWLAVVWLEREWQLLLLCLSVPSVLRQQRHMKCRHYQKRISVPSNVSVNVWPLTKKQLMLLLFCRLLPATSECWMCTESSQALHS